MVSEPPRRVHLRGHRKRFTIALPALPAAFQFLRVLSGSEAKKVKSTRSNCSARTLWMKVTSSFRDSSCPSASSSSRSFTSNEGKLRSPRSSASSFPLRLPAPTIARRNSFVPRTGSGEWATGLEWELMRFGTPLLARRGRSAAAPDDPQQPPKHARKHVEQCHAEQHPAREIPNAANRKPNNNDEAKRLAYLQVNVFEAVKAPRADHQVRNRDQHQHPGERQSTRK